MNGKELGRKYKFYNNRIDKLWTKNQKVEACLFMSLLVEFFIKDAIKNFEKIIEGASVSSGVYFNPKNLYTKQDIDSAPLGTLIKVLETYTNNKELITKLRQFSEKRNKCVHKLLQHEIKVVNSELKGFHIFYYTLIQALLELNIKQINLLKQDFSYCCDECFQKLIKEKKLL